ncbi:MAG: UpxY family transcription antiterminator [Ferruginibacter sp.]
MAQNNNHWYVVYTKPRWEKKVAAMLETKGIEHYCPLTKVERQWSDRKKTVEEPVFKSYVFVQVEEKDKWDLLKISGIVNYVHWLGKPARVSENEITTIRKFLNEFSGVEVVENASHVNSKVRIKHGVMMDYHGILLELSGNRACVKIESMGVQLTAFFDRKNIEVLKEKKV